MLCTYTDNCLAITVTFASLKMPEEKKKIPLSQRLRRKYRLVILNDESFEERFSLRLTPGGILIMVSAITIFMSILVTSLVAFTPIREYIPGYGDISDRKALIALSLKADSVDELIKAKNEYIENHHLRHLFCYVCLPGRYGTCVLQGGG